MLKLSADNILEPTNVRVIRLPDYTTCLDEYDSVIVKPEKGIYVTHSLTPVLLADEDYYILNNDNLYPTSDNMTHVSMDDIVSLTGYVSIYDRHGKLVFDKTPDGTLHKEPVISVRIRLLEALINSWLMKHGYEYVGVPYTYQFLTEHVSDSELFNAIPSLLHRIDDILSVVNHDRIILTERIHSYMLIKECGDIGAYMWRAKNERNNI